MRRFFQLLLLLSLVPLLVSCGPSDARVFHGYLYFVQGPYLMRFSLRDESISMVTHLGNRTVREISPFGEDRLLLSETASVNRRNVARISWLDLKTGQSEALYSGVRARFIAAAGTIVYDDGGTLYAVPLAGDTGVDSVVMSHERNRLSTMVTVADDRLLFEADEAGQPTVYLYRAVSGELVKLDALGALCTLEGAVWVDGRDALACRQRDGGMNGAGQDYVFAGLDGRVIGRPTLPEGDAFLALAYIRDQDVIVFRERRASLLGGKRSDALWAHDVAGGENHPLSAGQNLGSSVVYTAY